MPWNTPKLWSTGEHWTAALVNEQLRENMIALTPVVGELKMFVRAPTSSENVIGTNWLECNGVAVSRSYYSALFNVFAGMRSQRGSGSTTLAAAVDATSTSISINYYNETWPGGRSSWWNAPYNFSNGFLIQIDSEIMLVTSKGNWAWTTLTVVRAREGTTATSHASGATVVLYYDLPFGSGDGLTTFNLPDLHGRTPWSAARSGGHVDVTTIGRDDRTYLAGRRPKHRHGYDIGSTAAVGNGDQVPITAGTLGAGNPHWTSALGDWPYGTWGLFIGPLDEGGARALNTTPLDAPGYLVTGVWGIRFVGV